MRFSERIPVVKQHMTVVTDVLGQPVGQAVQEDGTNRPSQNVGN